MAKIAPKPVQGKYTTASASGIEGLMNKIPKGDGALLFDKTNYILMGIGVVLIAIGFILMSGGRHDPNVFDVNEIYSARRITVAPIMILLGFIVEIFAVLKIPSEKA
ncbi:MAG TPA: DUF3098 domain-containing protein [Chitinophagales bacterium]|nr:DUF3098 domain-containing protein [Chitinophagales bacterium]